MSGQPRSLDSREELPEEWSEPTNPNDQDIPDSPDAREASARSVVVEADPQAFMASVLSRADAVVGTLEDFDGDEFRYYMHAVVGNRRPFNKQEAILIAQMGRRDLLIEHNLLLVVDVALKWYSRGRSLMDLIGAGNIGLTEAGNRFDPARGYAFSTLGLYYVTSYVHHEVLDQDMRHASLPMTARRTFGALKGHQTRLSRDSGTRFTYEETAALLRRSQIAPPKHAAKWPDAAEVRRWQATMYTSYISQVVPKPADVAARDYWNGARDMIAGNEAAFADERDELGLAEARADIWQLSRDLGTLTRYRVISKPELRLLVLRYGIPHPRRDWKPPKGWRLGQPVTLREMARLAHRKREKCRQDFYHVLNVLRTDPSEIARRVYATLTDRSIFDRFYTGS